MNNTDIETFLMLVNTKNITRTAKNLYISQPTVSRRLKQLENELGYPLVNREKGEKQITLTPAGENFIPLAERWMALWRKMKEAGEENQRHYLSIGCTDTFNSAILLPLYETLWNTKRNELCMNISTHYSVQLYDMLENHEIDLGFVFHYLDYKSITAEPILEEDMFIVQPNNSFAVRKPVILTDELNLDNEIYLTWESHYEIWHNQWVQKDRRPGIEADTYLLLQCLLKAPGSWAIAPYSVVRKLQDNMDIYISKIGNEIQPPRRITYMIRNKFEHASLNESLMHFTYTLRKFLRDYFNFDKEKIRIYES
jgi:DNA-binding transcriptional LysR family regulator